MVTGIFRLITAELKQPSVAGFDKGLSVRDHEVRYRKQPGRVLLLHLPASVVNASLRGGTNCEGRDSWAAGRAL